eukprot:8007583-Pyramimonas_sp.AAC.1
MVNAVAPSASVATSHSSTMIARCPDGVFTETINQSPFPRRKEPVHNRVWNDNMFVSFLKD